MRLGLSVQCSWVGLDAEGQRAELGDGARRVARVRAAAAAGGGGEGVVVVGGGVDDAGKTEGLKAAGRGAKGGEDCSRRDKGKSNGEAQKGDQSRFLLC